MTTMIDSATATPERSLEQRMDALKAANAIRSYRSRLKRDIAASRQRIVPLLIDPPAELLTMKVAAVLLAVPKQGRVRVDRMLRDMAISPSKTVGGLSERQRRALAMRLGGR
jgi:hypothetical protein